MANQTNSVAKKLFLSKTGKNMFLWVTVCSIVSAISIVISITLIQRILFINKVINEKGITTKILSNNNSEIPKLQDAIRALNSNQNLINIKAHDSDEPIQVILDALPSEFNSAGLGSYLQELVAKYSEGLNISAVSVGTQDYASTDVSVPSEKVSGAFEIPISFAAEGPEVEVKNFLKNLEKSIRALDIRLVSIVDSPKEGVSKNVTVSFSGVAYYQPSKTIKIQEKELKQ